MRVLFDERADHTWAKMKKPDRIDPAYRAKKGWSLADLLYLVGL
jgi:hypothetical protein